MCVRFDKNSMYCCFFFQCGADKHIGVYELISLVAHIQAIKLIHTGEYTVVHFETYTFWIV